MAREYGAGFPLPPPPSRCCGVLLGVLRYIEYQRSVCEAIDMPSKLQAKVSAAYLQLSKISTFSRKPSEPRR
jgi:hypothetical protein